MARYDTIKQAIRDAIYQNTSGAITGEVLKNKLLDMISSLGNDSSFKGILSSTNKPTGDVDQKQWYLGYTSGNTITLDLSAVSLGTLNITKDSLYIVYNDDDGWNSDNLFAGIASYINGFEQRTALEQEQLYKSCGVGLCAFQAYEGVLPSISASGYILTPDGDFVSEGGTISVNEGDIIWVLPKDVSEEAQEIEEHVTKCFNLLVPSGSVGYESIASLAWSRVGIEVIGLSKTAIEALNEACANIYCCEPLYTVYEGAVTNLFSCQDHDAIINYLINNDNI